MQSILQIPEIQSGLEINQDAEHPTDLEIQSGLEINQDAEHPTDHGEIEQMGDQLNCRASYRSRRFRADGRSTKMQSILQIMETQKQMGDQSRCRASYRSRRHREDGRSTQMQSILQITEIQNRWEINQEAEHPTDHRDIEQMGDQPRCRASYRSWRYRTDGRSTKMHSILQILEMQSRLEINQDAEHPTDHRDIDQTGDQQRCRAD